MFIKDIDNKIAQTLKALNLRPELDLVKFKAQEKRFYTTPCLNKQGKKVLFKALISDNKENERRLKKEIALLKAFNKLAWKKNLGALKIIKANLKYPQWILRDYQEGKIIGHHFNLDNQSPAIRKQIIEILLALQKIKTETISIPLKKTMSSDYLKKINEFTKKDIIKKQAAKEILTLKEKFLKVKNLLNQNNNILCHGDFTLANFFVNKNKLYLTDWELAHLGNLASDIARMYIQTFKYPKWRDGLVKEYTQKINKNQISLFRELFAFEITYQAFIELSCNLLSRQSDPALQTSMRNVIIEQK